MVIEPGNNQINKAAAQPTSASGKRPGSGSVAESSQSEAPARQDSVSLSREAQTLGRLESRVQSEPEVDEAKVAAVRQALESGRYQIDSESIASRMLEQDGYL